MTPLMLVRAVLVVVSVLLRPFRTTLPNVVNSNGLLPPKVTEALFSVTALPNARPVVALVCSAPLLRISVPLPMAAVVPNSKVVPPSSAVEPIPKLFAVGSFSVPPPATDRFALLPGGLMAGVVGQGGPGFGRTNAFPAREGGPPPVGRRPPPGGPGAANRPR